MKFILLFLCFLIYSSNLLENVRKEIIDIALLYLPKRENVDFLKMINEMLKAKIKYSMNKVESAYFAYKWISKNIEYNCNYIIEEEISTEIILTYNEGKGGTIGVTGLFNRLCELLNVDSKIITGLTKITTYNKTQLIDIKNYAWNSVFINKKYYLIDPIMGAGSCSGTRFYKSQSDKFFGINPKDSIRQRFPNKKEWQLLSEPVTKDKFSSMALISEGFFNYFKTFSPDVQTLRNEEDIKIVMTFDKPIDKIEIFASMDSMNYEEREDTLLPEIYILDEPTISNGACSISIPVMDTGYLHVGIRVNNKESFGVTYVTYYFPNNS